MTRNALTPGLESAFATLRATTDNDRCAVARGLSKDIEDYVAPVHWTDDEVRAAADAIGEVVDAGAVLRTLAGFPECAHYGTGPKRFPVQVVWSRKAKFVSDVLTTDLVIGRASLVPERERDLWTGEDAPWVRLLLHLPCWMVATQLERERAVHAMLMGWALSPGGDRLVRRRPDLVLHAATAGRFGVETPRGIQAIQHAIANPVTAAHLDHAGQLVWDFTQRAAAHAAELRRQLPLQADGDAEPLAKKPKGKGPKGKGGTQLKIVGEE